MSSNSKKHWLFNKPIAHRGLHMGSTIPENSLLAFKMAKDKGFPIEFDVQITKDNEFVVFHDDSLKRLCGVDKRVNEVTLEELKGLNLFGTTEGIPTLKAALDFIDGQVPLLIEVKAKSVRKTRGLEKTLVELLSKYQGCYALLSFNPLLLRQVQKLDANIEKVLAFTTDYDKDVAWWKRLLLNTFVLNHGLDLKALACDVKTINSSYWQVVKKLSLPIVAWTITSEMETNHLVAENVKNIIFENMNPEGWQRRVGE